MNTNLFAEVALPLVIGIIAGVLVLAVAVFVVVALNRRKGSDGDKNREDRELIAENARAVEALLVLAEGNKELTTELKELQEKIEYLTPSPKDEILDFDKKIKNLIGDLRIALTKADGEESKKSDNVIKQIKLTIADRGVKQQ